MEQKKTVGNLGLKSSISSVIAGQNLGITKRVSSNMSGKKSGIVKRLSTIIMVGLLMLGVLMCAGCARETPEIKAINAGILAFNKLNNGKINIQMETHAENGVLTKEFAAKNSQEFTFKMSRRGFDYLLVTSASDAPAIYTKVVGGVMETYTMEAGKKVVAKTGLDFQAASNDIYERPGEIKFMSTQLKAGQVGELVSVQDPTGSGRIGYKVIRDQKFMDQVNKGRGNDPTKGLVQENSIIYWLNDEGLLVGMEYLTRDKISAAGKEDVINMTLKYEVVSHNDPDFAEI